MNIESTYSKRIYKIKDLNRLREQVNIIFRVIGKDEKQEFTSRNSNEIQHIYNYRIANKTATMLLTLYNEDIDVIEVGKSYKLSNGLISTAKNGLRLMKGKKGFFERIIANELN